MNVAFNCYLTTKYSAYFFLTKTDTQVSFSDQTLYVVVFFVVDVFELPDVVIINFSNFNFLFPEA